MNSFIKKIIISLSLLMIPVQVLANGCTVGCVTTPLTVAQGGTGTTTLTGNDCPQINSGGTALISIPCPNSYSFGAFLVVTGTAPNYNVAVTANPDFTSLGIGVGGNYSATSYMVFATNPAGTAVQGCGAPETCGNTQGVSPSELGIWNLSGYSPLDPSQAPQLSLDQSGNLGLEGILSATGAKFTGLTASSPLCTNTSKNLTTTGCNSVVSVTAGSSGNIIVGGTLSNPTVDLNSSINVNRIKLGGSFNGIITTDNGAINGVSCNTIAITSFNGYDGLCVDGNLNVGVLGGLYATSVIPSNVAVSSPLCSNTGKLIVSCIGIVDSQSFVIPAVGTNVNVDYSGMPKLYNANTPMTINDGTNSISGYNVNTITSSGNVGGALQTPSPNPSVMVFHVTGINSGAVGNTMSANAVFTEGSGASSSSGASVSNNVSGTTTTGIVVQSDLVNITSIPQNITLSGFTVAPNCTLTYEGTAYASAYVVSPPTTTQLSVHVGTTPVNIFYICVGH